MNFTLEGQIVDVINRKIYPGKITIENGIIADVEAIPQAPNHLLMPGFVDAHIHIESSMLVPSRFAELASVHGTVATVSDPHEIANVMGVEGVKYMIKNGKTVPFKFFFGAPSCVPATNFETAGAVVDSKDIHNLLSMDEVLYLAEMMNFPGVLHSDAEVMQKIEHAKKHGKPIDGHAPGLRGKEAETYFAAGISTDHECFSYEEGLEKANLGVKILIREGSAAKNFNDLIPLLKSHPEQIMFCSDDKHPNDLRDGHINELVKQSLQLGYDRFDVLRAVTLNPTQHYDLPVGLMRKGDPADFIVVNSFESFNIKQTYINGLCVAEDGKNTIKASSPNIINQFSTTVKRPQDFKLEISGNTANVIQIIDRQIVTDHIKVPVSPKQTFDEWVKDDILKITVVNRYSEGVVPAVSLVKGSGIQRGAIASSVAHDSHNIVAIGTSDDEICRAVNLLIEAKGGVVWVDGDNHQLLELPVAGLMTTEDPHIVAQAYEEIDSTAKTRLGSSLTSPFMSLSFLALLVIPSLKLSDKGLFNGQSFEFQSLFE